LLAHWAKFPTRAQMRRLYMVSHSDWRETGEAREDLREFAADTGVPVGSLDHMPPHLRACLESARLSIQSGKVN
jgi:hypothetical protein